MVVTRGTTAEAAATRIGVDLGGTKIEAVALQDDRVCVRRRVATPHDYTSILEAVGDIVDEVEADIDDGVHGRPVGIGTPGALSPLTGLLENSNTVALNGRPLDVDLAQHMGREVALDNDANCLALSEASDGAAARARSVFAAILGTGVGGGLVFGGQLVRGANAIAGEWGHNPLPYSDAWERPGPVCYCGKRGCIETFLSGAGLAREFSLRTGHHLDGPAIAELARQGESNATATLHLYAERLARALAVVINIVDPEVIVLGGGLSNLTSLYTEVPRLLPRWVFTGSGRGRELLTRIVPARWGDSSGVRGAARLGVTAPPT